MRRHSEHHRVERVGWLRAAVLGANDGIISTTSLVVGVAAAGAATSEILIAGTAGLVAGAMSMAAGEYVSVSSQADSEQAELAIERRELRQDREYEVNELADIYVGRGVEARLAREVAKQMMAKDALGAHARDELGITEATRARPLQAAFASAAMFTAGAALPLLLVLLSPAGMIARVAAAGALIGLAMLGAAGAKAGGAAIWPAVARVVFWGALAMGLTAGIGALVGVAV